MPTVFKKIKVKAKSGRGDGDYDEMMTGYLAGDLQTMVDCYAGLSAAEKDDVKGQLNGFQDGLGDALDSGKEDYEMACLDVNDKEGFFNLLENLGASSS